MGDGIASAAAFCPLRLAHRNSAVLPHVGYTYADMSKWKHLPRLREALQALAPALVWSLQLIGGPIVALCCGALVDEMGFGHRVSMQASFGVMGVLMSAQGLRYLLLPSKL